VRIHENKSGGKQFRHGIRALFGAGCEFLSMGLLDNAGTATRDSSAFDPNGRTRAPGARYIGLGVARFETLQEYDMGLLDSIVGQVSGALAGAAPGAGQMHPGLLDVVSTLLTDSQSGGIQGLINQFEQQGLGHLVASWVGTGQNLAITPEQVQSVLGEPHIAAVARQLGLSTADVTNQLAGLLPHAVDSVTPAGTVPESNLLSQAFSAFAALRR
jgi:uncharacterized protein YidB (DUF937 family)